MSVHRSINLWGVWYLQEKSTLKMNIFDWRFWYFWRLSWRLWKWRNWCVREDLIFMQGIWSVKNFVLVVSFSLSWVIRNTVLLKGVEVTHWNEFPHDAQPKPNPTKSLKWGIRVTWGLSQLRVPTVSIATPSHWSYPLQRSYCLRALVSNHVGMLPGYK